MLDNTMLCRLPPRPTCNRWTKLYPSIAWWLVSLSLFNVIHRCWLILLTRLAEAAECTDEREINVYHLVGHETDKTVAAIARSRARKPVTFLTAPGTPTMLTVLALVLRPALNFMGHPFQDSSTT